MVNFGPYGDYLNSRVNDDENEGNDDNHNERDRPSKETQPNLQHTTRSNSSNMNQHHGNENVVFVHGDGMIDDFYNY